MTTRLLGALLLCVTTGGAAPAAQVALVDVHEVRAAAKPGRGANCANAGAETGTYALTGWQVAGPTTATFNTRTKPSSLATTATLAALQASYDAWSAASPAPAITVVTSTTSAVKPTANHRYELMFGKASGGTLAVTYTWRWADGSVESDTLFNTAFTWANLGPEGDGCDETAGNVYDLANIGTHEFGHTYGLDHPANARFETMYAYGYSGETAKRSVATGDVAGANALY